MKRVCWFFIFIMLVLFSLPVTGAEKTGAGPDVNLSPHDLHFRLVRPASAPSNQEVLEVYVVPGDRNWVVRIGFPAGLVHENGSFYFPSENIYHLESDDVINNGKGQAVIRLILWADIRESWNQVLAGNYSGEMVVTITERL